MCDLLGMTPNQEISEIFEKVEYLGINEVLRIAMHTRLVIKMFHFGKSNLNQSIFYAKHFVRANLSRINDFVYQFLIFWRYQLTKDDIELLGKINNAPNDQYKHIVRWYNHIKAVGGHLISDDKKGGKCEKSAKKDEDDDDLDLFGSDDEEDTEAERVKQERLKAYAEKKSKKPALIAKSSVVLDVKPWDDETDMKELEAHVRSVQMEGLLWGVSKLVPVGYGIHKLQIGSVIEDEKVSVDLLTEEIEKFEDYVQSVDIAAFNKI